MSVRPIHSLGAAATLLTVLVAGCATKPKPAPAPAPAARPMAPPPAPPPAPIQSAPMGPVPGSVKDFEVNVGDRVYFDYDQDAIRADAKPVLDAQAAWLQRYPSVTVRIEGNADERGTREYNFALGGRRAAKVREYLLAHGVAESRMTTISYGKERPIDLGNSEEAWAHNRNAHTAIVGGAR